MFPKAKPQLVQKLNESAYSYFCFLLAFDDFLDIAQNSNKRQKMLNLLAGLEKCENAIRQLTLLYPEPTTFWESFLACKQAYFKAVVAEKEFSAKQADFTEDIFQEIAKGKSAVCLNTVYAFSILGENTQNNDALINCINELHIALQYVDDIDDFKKDILENQWTYPHFLLKMYLQNQAIDWQNTDTEIKQKYLFLSGIASKCLKKAIFHYQNAINIATDLDLIDFSNYLKRQRNTLEFRIDEIGFLIAKTNIKAQKSQVILANNTLKNALSKSKNYLLHNIEPDNTWSDFMTSAGTGKAWITGYTAMMLAEFEPNLPLLQTLKEQMIANPKRFLSYNEGILQDADSTNFILGFLALMQENKQEITTLWFSFMQDNGGWATYNNEKHLRNLLDLPDDISVSAWLNSHVCVSAVSANILHLCNENDLYHKTCVYLLAQIKEDHWQSYWWTSPIYATAFSIMALCKNETYRKHCSAPAQYLAKLQNEDGSWQNPHQNLPNAFYTALAIKTLLIFDATIFKKNIEAGINWLVSNQTEDGSWQSNRILRIPATDETQPENVEKWRNSSFGVNCITEDHNRIFTTVTVWNCLLRYMKFVEKERGVVLPNYPNPLTF